jgi:hypothetical protein
MTGTVTSDQLGAFANEHLLYEVEMLRELTAKLKEVVEHARAGHDVDEVYPVVVRNAMVESFAVRTRLLVDFIYGYGSHKDDTFAEHYVDGRWAPAKLDWVEEARDKVNKGVAHLTYHRLLDERKGWQFEEIWLDLARLLRDFASEASPDRLPPEAAKKIINLVEPIDGHDAFRTIAAAASQTQTQFVVSTTSQSGPIIRDVPTTSVSEIVDQLRRKEV